MLIFTSLISAGIVIQEQPNQEYYSGETLKIPFQITSAKVLNGFLEVTLDCDDKESQIHKEFIVLLPGDEKETYAEIPLIKKFIGKSTGDCKIKADLEEYTTESDEFTITNEIEIETSDVSEGTNPGEKIKISGLASKTNGKNVDGFIEITIDNADVKIKDVVVDGEFDTEFKIPKDTKAGLYYATIEVYEEDYFEEQTNYGKESYSFRVAQVANNLELIIDNQEIEPGELLRIKPILHDQSGENIATPVLMTITNSRNEIIKSKDIETGEYYELEIASGELPSEWNIQVESVNFTQTKTAQIQEQYKIETSMVNNTLIVTNIGNVKYNKTVSVKIANKTNNVETDINVGESKNYFLSAPTGEYNVDISATGQEVMSGSVMLTGNVISVKEASKGIINFVGKPIVWIFIILVVGVLSFFIYKRGYKKSFFGYIYKKNKPKTKIVKEEVQDTLTNPIEKAKFNLSIKGSKQDSTFVCLKIKNLDEIKKDTTNSKSTLQKLTTVAAKEKAMTYENGSIIFFIFAPVKTKTFDNEKAAMHLTGQIQTILDHHNKMFKQKIDYGLAINNGVIVANLAGKTLNFAQIGSFTGHAKKIATISKGEVLLGEPVKDKLIKDIVTQRHTHENLHYYSIKEIKNTSEKREMINALVSRMKNQN